MLDSQPGLPGEPKPDPTVARPESGYVRVSPVGVQMQGRTLQRAADLVRADPHHQPDAVAFLYCRAIELAFKAYLVARGQSVASMVQYGHDLTLLLIETDARGLDRVIKLTPSDKELIRTAGVLYEDHKLGYFDLWHTLAGPRLPMDQLASIAMRLLDAVEGPCLEAADAPTWRPPEL